MNKATLNTLTTFIPVLVIVFISMILIFNPFASIKSAGLILLLIAFPIQGFVIIFRKEVFFKYWLSKREKIFDGLLCIIIGIVIIFLYLKETGYLN